MSVLKRLFALIKPYLRWIILGATLVFLGQALANHWQEVVSIEITNRGWGIIVGATVVTLLSHMWSGWVWTLTLKEFRCTVPKLWTIRVYLKTNIAKYLPGNVWHFYGRVRAMHAANVPWAIAILSVIIEPLLDVSAALIVAIGLGGLHRPVFQLIGLAIVLAMLHPAILNPGTHYLSKLKLKPKGSSPDTSSSNTEATPTDGNQPPTIDVEPGAIDAAIMTRYPAIPLLGEIIFFILRSLGFLLVVVAMEPLSWDQVPILMSSFSVAYFLGLVVPGAPGGLGVFEASLVAFLELHFSAGLLLRSVAIYRLISILAEITGAALASVEFPMTRKQISQ